MALTTKQIAKTVTDFGSSEKDTGKPEVQVALLTERIKQLTEHFKTHKKDHSSRRSLYKVVGQRKKLIKYIKKCDIERYRKIIADLGIRK